MQKWTRLRDNFRKGLKTRALKGGPGASRRPLKFKKELAFLKYSLASPENSERAANSDTNNQEENNELDFDMQSSISPSRNANVPISSRPSQVSISNQTTDSIFAVLKTCLESKVEQDPVSLFFSAMAATVQKLPERLQIEVRQKVFNVVSEAELQWLSERDGDNLYTNSCSTPTCFDIKTE